MSKNHNNTIVAYQGKPINVVGNNMKSVAASQSEPKYNDDNTTFILWLYDNQDLIEKLLRDWFLTQLIEKEAIDTNTKVRKNIKVICKIAPDGLLYS